MGASRFLAGPFLISIGCRRDWTFSILSDFKTCFRSPQGRERRNDKKKKQKEKRKKDEKNGRRERRREKKRNIHTKRPAVEIPVSRE